MGKKNQFRTIRKDGSLSVRPPKGMNVFDLYHELLRISWIAFAFFSSAIYFVTNLTFGFFYYLLPREQFDGYQYTEGFMRYLESFFFSVQTFGTIGYGKISPIGVMANLIVTVEAYASLFLVALMTGIIFARFARPRSKVLFSETAVIRKFDGIPSLLFRIANSRQNFITEARVRVTLVMDNPKTRFREFTDLKLEREVSAVFALSWTIAHDIDTTSPLYGLDWETMCELNMELIVTFVGVDTTLANHVYAKHSYVTDEILVDHDFVDVVKRNADGTIELLIDRFHQVKPVIES